MDVPSTAAGIVRELKVQRGSRVSQGDVIARGRGCRGRCTRGSPRQRSEAAQQPRQRPDASRAARASGPAG